MRAINQTCTLLSDLRMSNELTTNIAVGAAGVASVVLAGWSVSKLFEQGPENSIQREWREIQDQLKDRLPCDVWAIVTENSHVCYRLVELWAFGIHDTDAFVGAVDSFANAIAISQIPLHDKTVDVKRKALAVMSTYQHAATVAMADITKATAEHYATFVSDETKEANMESMKASMMTLKEIVASLSNMLQMMFGNIMSELM